MKKGDKGKKVLGVILVLLILNGFSRRFKGELGENKRVVNYYES